MPEFKTAADLIKSGFVPAKGARRSGPKKDKYNTEKVEVAVTGPFWAPRNKKAAVFYSKNKTAYYRRSESEKTYSKTMLKKEFGIKTVDHVEPCETAYSSKLRNYYGLYRLSDFGLVPGTSPESERELDDLTVSERYYRLVSDYYGGVKRRQQVASSPRIKCNLIGMNRVELSLVNHKGRPIVKLKANISLQSMINKYHQNHPELSFGLTAERYIRLLFSSVVQKTDNFIAGDYDYFCSAIIAKHDVITASGWDETKIIAKLQAHLAQLRSRIDRQVTQQKLLAEHSYVELFPARQVARKITLFIAPTNSGKTYQACQLVKDALTSNDASAACFFPLRALAAQLKDEFVDEGIATSLITGEEREIDPLARLECCTTESINTSRKYSTEFIDEAQLLFDVGRRAAYARAILGAYCDHLILAVAPAYAQALKTFIETHTGESIEEMVLDRLCPLKVCGTVPFSQIQKGDAIVAYSARLVHDIANKLNHLGHKVGVIYGRMSPSARREMVRKFKEVGCGILVCTDAIGMGISLPIKRVLFAEGDKYDGCCVRPLKDEEIRQVAGRAGRFGFYDIGYVGVVHVPNIRFQNKLKIKRLKHVIEKINPIREHEDMVVGPDKHTIMSAESLSISDALSIWDHAMSSHPGTKVCRSNFAELMDKALMIEDIKSLDRDIAVHALYVNFPGDRNDYWRNFYCKILKKIANKNKVSADEIIEHHQLAKHSVMESIADLEYSHIALSILSQFQRFAPELFDEEAYLMDCHANIGEQLTQALLKLYANIHEAKVKEAHKSVIQVSECRP